MAQNGFAALDEPGPWGSAGEESMSGTNHEAPDIEAWISA